MCPLCQASGALFFQDARRSYYQCCDCTLVFVPHQFWLSSAAERRVYDLHQNECFDEGYRRFLARLSNPLLQRLEEEQRGLDFGCGPASALASVLEEAGHVMELYDPYYSPDTSVLQRRYDFICATEVVEHLHDPAREFERLFALLKPGGWLAIMTKLVIDKERFRTWHYIRDPTHVCFFSKQVFLYLGRRFHAHVKFVDKDVIFLRRE